MTDQSPLTAALTEGAQRLETAVEDVETARNTHPGVPSLDLIDSLTEAATALLRALTIAKGEAKPATQPRGWLIEHVDQHLRHQPDTPVDGCTFCAPGAGTPAPKLADPIDPQPGDIWHDVMPSFTGGTIWHARADANGDVEFYQPNFRKALVPARAIKSMRGGMTLIGGAEPVCPTCKSGQPTEKQMVGCGFVCDDPSGWHANGGVARYV